MYLTSVHLTAADKYESIIEIHSALAVLYSNSKASAIFSDTKELITGIPMIYIEYEFAEKRLVTRVACRIYTAADRRPSEISMQPNL